MSNDDAVCPTKGSKAFLKFLSSHKISYDSAAKALSYSRAGVRSVAQGWRRPGIQIALRIERWTGGQVRFLDFSTAAEARGLAKLKPYTSSSKLRAAA